MKLKDIIALTAIVLFFGCTQNRPEKSTSSSGGNEDKLGGMLDRYWEQRSRFFPLDATQQGDNRFNSILPNDQTQAFRDSLRTFYQSYLAEVQKYNRDSLDENDQLSYDIFKYEMEVQLEAFKYKQWMIPFQQFWGLPLTMGQIGSGGGFQPFKTPADYRNWLGRVRGFSLWTDSAIANFRKGIKAGVVLPKSLVEKMIPQMNGMVVADATESFFYGPVRKFPKEFSEQDRKALTNEYKQAITEQLIPSYKKLADFLKKEYLPKARATSGIAAIPQGRELYKYLARYWTTTDLPPDSIYMLGLKEVKRIKFEMEKVKHDVNFIGTLPEFFNYMKTEPKFMPFKTPQDVINAFKGIQQTIDPKLNNLFGRKPRTPFEIRQTEAFRAASASAEYVQGTPDGSRPGIFYIPILDATKFNITSGMESLFLHEAIPGHHYQISLQQENQDLPKFRQFAWYGAYGEGWALYCESLGKELGVYTDPFQYMGALGDEMHRAVRLVVDVGIHVKGMGREEAIKFMMENEAISREGAVAEVERYMAIPGQALSYKIGALKVWDLRNKYQTELGRKFRLSDFHDKYLEDGCMPLAVAESKMDAWAAKKKD